MGVRLYPKNEFKAFELLGVTAGQLANLAAIDARKQTLLENAPTAWQKGDVHHAYYDLQDSLGHLTEVCFGKINHRQVVELGFDPDGDETFSPEMCEEIASHTANYLFYVNQMTVSPLEFWEQVGGCSWG